MLMQVMLILFLMLELLLSQLSVILGGQGDGPQLDPLKDVPTDMLFDPVRDGHMEGELIDELMSSEGRLMTIISIYVPIYCVFLLKSCFLHNLWCAAAAWESV